METATEKSKQNFNIMPDTETIIMRKKGSPHKIRIAPDPEDPHFSLVQLLKVSTGEQKGRHIILTSDAPQWRSMYEADGFVALREREVCHD